MTMPSTSIRQNVFYSVLDYVSQPAIMLIAAPLLLRTLGVQQYGTWMLVNSIAATASGLGGGFGDGATKYVSMYRSSGDHNGAARSVAAVLAVNCAFGLLSAVIMIACAPWLIGHVFAVGPNLRHAGIVALRVSAALLVVRFAEAVFTCALRGCEQYRPMVAISVVARTSVTLSALALALRGHGLIAIFWATLAIGLLSLACQAWLAHRTLKTDGSWHALDLRTGIRDVFSFGAFTWLKSTFGILTGYADRLLVAGLLGTGPLAFYALCNQLTQPIHALMASAFNFIFPNFSAQTASGRWSETAHRYRVASASATLVVLTICATMIAGAKTILRLWLGNAVAGQYHGLLIAMVIGNGLLALSVVPHYAALALGRSRALVFVNLGAGVLSLAVAYILIRSVGLMGAGFAKIIAGAVFLSVFGIVRRALKDGGSTVRSPNRSAAAAGTLDLAQ
ncbi:MAG TPA: oligosaccharide flippase family protein [Verrucomicrobiae bacterium]|jgi:O-antigen/teichoic acid export membrane protein|nr:oligosaccharide flippase family protein [Verrucomicrobiae bacterium]